VRWLWGLTWTPLSVGVVFALGGIGSPLAILLVAGVLTAVLAAVTCGEERASAHPNPKARHKEE
jgi:hypothetical protein